MIPRIVRHEVREDGTLSEGEVVEAREGISRDMEVDIVFDEAVAVKLRDWLGRQIARLRELKQKQGEEK